MHVCDFRQEKEEETQEEVQQAQETQEEKVGRPGEVYGPVANMHVNRTGMGLIVSSVSLEPEVTWVFCGW